ncbi:MAG: four-carbon acid sugar kinase family protein [Elusimicrobiota bacterium]
MLIAVIADDLTGCGDAGIFFRQAGLSTQIINSFPADNLKITASVVLINTESRADKPETAYKKVKKAARFLKSLQPLWIYKKIDSTLRGNIGPELDALCDVFLIKSLTFVAAFPQMKRVTINSWQYVNGTRLDKSPFAEDLTNPVKEAHLPTLLAKTCNNWDKIKVYDASTGRDLQKIARANRRQKFFCGAAGLIKYLLKETYLLPSSKTLIVAGSRNPISIAQIKKVETNRKGSANPIILKINKKLSPGEAAIFLAAQAKKIIEKERINKLILVGGKTAYSICKALNIDSLTICKTVLPGIAHCHSREGKEIILKPGGFGSTETLSRCLKYFQNY